MSGNDGKGKYPEIRSGNLTLDPSQWCRPGGVWHDPPSPRSLSDYLWGNGAFEDQLISEYPQLEPDRGKMHSTLLDSMIFNNTQLAVKLGEEFPYGTAIMNGGVMPYAMSWDPFSYAGFAKALTQQHVENDQIIWTCLRNLGFDEQFVEATISLEHTVPWGYFLPTSSNPLLNDVPGGLQLDPAVYGNHPIIAANPMEPGFILRKDGHIVFGLGGCPISGLYYYDYSVTPPKETYEDSIASCYGGHYILLIVPQKVVDQLGEGVVRKAGTFAGSVASGDIFDLIARQEHQDETLKYQVNWQQWQSDYSTLVKALNDYSISSGLNYNFTHFERFPYDTRFLPSIESKIIWESFPSPLEEVLLQFSSPSITTSKIWQCLQDPYNCNWGTYSAQTMAQQYANRVYAYLQKYGLFVNDWKPDPNKRREGIIRPWLAHYFSQAQVDVLPEIDIQEYNKTWSVGTNTYARFQTVDALARLQQPSKYGFSPDQYGPAQTSATVSSTSSTQITASPEMGPQSVPIYVNSPENNQSITNSTIVVTTVTKTVSPLNNQTQLEAGVFIPLPGTVSISKMDPAQWGMLLALVIGLSAFTSLFFNKYVTSKEEKTYLRRPRESRQLLLTSANNHQAREVQQILGTIVGPHHSHRRRR